MSDINILLLGQTGVGKSTFINSFINYLQYSTFEEALEQEIFITIPVRFSLIDENKKTISVEKGSSINERTEIGVSQTKGCMSYTFPLGDRKLRIIDTPGIGDTRGPDHDKINIENIMTFLGNFEHLHAICFLFNASETKVHPMFEFCIKRLLENLDKSAANNLIFLFTNTRGRDYSAGDTGEILRKLFKQMEAKSPELKIPFDDKNTFCVDNEGLRYVLAVKEGGQFNKRALRNCSESWEESFNTYNRMMIYITGDETTRGLTPHNIKKSIGVYQVRENIYIHSQPITKLAELSQAKIQETEKKKEYLNGTHAEISKININELRSRTVLLNKPILVCKSYSCIKTEKLSNNQEVTIYSTVCHDPCETAGPRGWTYWCDSMSFGKCQNCGCSHDRHESLTSKVEVYYEENPTLKNILNEKTSEKEKTEKLLVTLDQLLAEYRIEYETVMKHMAMCALFVKNNSILPVDDYMKNYLKVTIATEESNGNFQKAQIYRTLLETHELQHKFLVQQYTHNTDIVASVEMIMRSLDTVFNLKHIGQEVKELFAQAKSNAKQQGLIDTFYPIGVAIKNKLGKLFKTFT